MKSVEEKSKDELVDELEQMRQRIRTMEVLATKHRQVEQALKENEEKLRRMFEAVTDGIRVVDLNGIIVDVNERILEIYGFDSKKEILGRSAFDLFPAREHERVRKNMLQTLELGSMRGLEYALLKTDGSECTGELSASVLRDDSGKPVGFITVTRDITKRKQAEQKIEVLYANEKTLRRNLEDEMKRRVEFTRTLVHELKTPLTPIIAASELLLEELKEEHLVHLAGSIQRSAVTMNRRIDALLDLAKGELGILKLDYSKVDTLQLLHRVTDSMSPVASMRNLSFALDIPSSLPMVEADESRLEQVFLNLLTNAFKWTPEGGKVMLRAREKQANLVVEVQDTGPGIARENHQKIFEAYYRVETKRQHPSGLGLGLALCKMIVETHGGRIWVESEEGKGSTFIFTMPLIPEHTRKS